MCDVVAPQMYQQLYKASPVMCHAYMMEVARRVATEQGPAAADDVKLKLVSSFHVDLQMLDGRRACSCSGSTWHSFCIPLDVQLRCSMGFAHRFCRWTEYAPSRFQPAFAHSVRERAALNCAAALPRVTHCVTCDRALL